MPSGHFRHGDLAVTGVVAPAGTPTHIVTLLQDAIAETIAMPAVQSALGRDLRRRPFDDAGGIPRPDRPRHGALEGGGRKGEHQARLRR
jgi:hypothetical protein